MCPPSFVPVDGCWMRAGSGMTTAEKRAQLEAEGTPWPDCECHGQPKYWNGERSGGRFRCAVRKREANERRRQKFRDQGVCVFCGGDLEASSLCADCLDSHRDAVWRHDQTPYRKMKSQLHEIRRRRRRRADEGFRPSGVGLAAFAAWKDKQPGS